jgi:3-dehydroquinate dehydratase-2
MARPRSPPSGRAARNSPKPQTRSCRFISRTTKARLSISFRAREEADAIIINPAAYSFTSIAMLDALKIFEGPIIEVHISNIHARDELHRHSKLSAAATAVICGLGAYGYIVGMQAALHMLGKLPDTLPVSIRVGPQ